MNEISTINILGEEFQPRSDKTLFWRSENCLIVSDIHLGKTATFRVEGIPVPEGITDSDLGKLSLALIETAAKKLIITGDLFHSPKGKTKFIIDRFKRFRDENKDIEINLITGNHDIRSGSLHSELCITETDSLIIREKFRFIHENDNKPGYYNFSGHIHPAIRLKGKGRQSLRLPCFYFAKDYALLPAFGGFTGTAVIYPVNDSIIYAIADNELVKLTS